MQTINFFALKEVFYREHGDLSKDNLFNITIHVYKNNDGVIKINRYRYYKNTCE